LAIDRRSAAANATTVTGGRRETEALRQCRCGDDEKRKTGSGKG
jgi:hypothetical protein